MRSTLLSALAFVLLAAFSSPADATGAVSRSLGATAPPSFVIVLLDDMRKDDFAAMPRTRALVGRPGATFERAYSTYPLCCPARSSLLNGQYAHNHGVLSNLPPLGGVRALRPQHTLAPWLRRSGYATAYLGKYLNGYGVQTTQEHVPRGWTWWEGLAAGGYRRFTLNVNGSLQQYDGVYQSNVLGRRATRFVRRAGNRPLLMVASFLGPHSGGPIEPDDTTGELGCFNTGLCNNATPAVSPVYANTESGNPMPVSPAYDEEDVSDKPGHIESLPNFESEFPALHQELFEQRREAVRSIDDQVAAIVQALRDTGRLRRTYVVVTSDNGFLMGEHRVPFGKVHPYEPSVRVPLVMRGPGIPARSRVEQLVGLHDLAPTVLRATGAYGAQTVPLDGRSLLPMTTSDRVAARRDLVLEAGPVLAEPDDSSVRRSSPAARPYRGILTNTGWKYVRYDTGEIEMYDLRSDPHELVNLADDPAFAARRAALAAGLDRLADCAGAGCLVDAAR
jgi:N-acetylglucosamine-6-sulfatase